jgi:F0F1-type ATP synthase delta subunit
VLNLIDRVKKSTFTKSTLGGCIVEENDNFILISKESKLKKMSYHAEK